MHPAEVVALGFRYPTPGAAELLGRSIAESTRGTVERHMAAFHTDVASLSLGQWEELHTATLDLSPKFVPYVGHVTWGENYRRGEFMADVKGELARTGVDLLGELPDHLEPLLRYLAVADHPLPDVAEVLPTAITSMQETLRAEDPDNPYRHLLAAAAAVAADLRPLTIGARR